MRCYARSTMAGLAMMACADAQVTRELDAGAVDPLRCSGALPVMQVRDPVTAELLDPDWSCFEKQAAAPPPARALPFRLSFPGVGSTPSADVEAGLNMLVMGATADVFFGPSTLGAPSHTHVFDRYSTVLDVPAASTSFSVVVHGLTRDVPGLSLMEQHHYGIPIAADATLLQASITLQDSHRLAINLSLGGGEVDPDKASLTAIVQDCTGRNVLGARLALVDMQSDVELTTSTEPGAFREAYVQSALPAMDCTHTTADWPAWFAFNAPVNIDQGANQHRYRLRVSGRMRASELGPRVFAERELELFAGAITTVDGFERVAR